MGTHEGGAQERHYRKRPGLLRRACGWVWVVSLCWVELHEGLVLKQGYRRDKNQDSMRRNWSLLGTSLDRLSWKRCGLTKGPLYVRVEVLWAAVFSQLTFQPSGDPETLMATPIL